MYNKNATDNGFKYMENLGWKIPEFSVPNIQFHTSCLKFLHHTVDSKYQLSFVAVTITFFNVS